MQSSFRERHLVFDGTYFSHVYCLLIFWDPCRHGVVTTYFCAKESYFVCVPWFTALKQQGLHPHSITMDGNTQIIRAIREVWPGCTIQRCLYHIQRQGLMWLRRYPKSELARELKHILSLLTFIKTHSQEEEWWRLYNHWRLQFKEQLRVLDIHNKVDSDIVRTFRMVENAAQDMFHFLDDRHIPSTSNGAESYFSWLKDHYKKHRGLRKTHLENYLLWYVYLNKTQN